MHQIHLVSNIDSKPQLLISCFSYFILLSQSQITFLCISMCETTFNCFLYCIYKRFHVFIEFRVLCALKRPKSVSQISATTLYCAIWWRFGAMMEPTFRLKNQHCASLSIFIITFFVDIILFNLNYKENSKGYSFIISSSFLIRRFARSKMGLNFQLKIWNILVLQKINL